MFKCILLIVKGICIFILEVFVDFFAWDYIGTKRVIEEVETKYRLLTGDAVGHSINSSWVCVCHRVGCNGAAHDFNGDII